MGIGHSDLQALATLARNGLLAAPPSAVCDIGAQQINSAFFTDPSALAALIDVCRPVQPRPPELNHVGGVDPPARLLWTWLGFEYAAIDVDGSPGAIFLDLNVDSVPPTHWQRYALVTNCGTTEHVINQMNAMAVIHDLTAPGGIMLHNLPAQGYFNHGLVNYNPKFFWALAKANDYKWLSLSLSKGAPVTLPDNILGQLPPGSATQFAHYAVPDCGMMVVMQKHHAPRAFVAPLDGYGGAAPLNTVLMQRYEIR